MADRPVAGLARRASRTNLSWIDQRPTRPLARIVVFYNPYRTPQTELFNRRITRTYVPATPVAGAPVNGFTCTWKAAPSGALTFDPKCGPSPTSFYLNDDLAKLTFYDQHVIAQKRDIGRIVTVNVTARQGPAARRRQSALPGADRDAGPQDRRHPPTGGDLRRVDPGDALPRQPRDADPALPRGPERPAGADRRRAGATTPPVTTLPAGKVTDVTLHAAEGHAAVAGRLRLAGRAPGCPGADLRSAQAERDQHRAPVLVDLQGARIAVTGAGGFIGRAVCRAPRRRRGPGDRARRRRRPRATGSSRPVPRSPAATRPTAPRCVARSRT